MKKLKEVKSNASNLHRDVYNLLKEIYPSDDIRQEVTIKIDGKNLFLDIYMPNKKIAIEAMGNQHYKFNKFFFENKSAFAAQIKNDEAKRKYCEIQGISLIEIKYNDPLTKMFLMDKILEALK